MKFKCPLDDGYFNSINHFGLMYKIDMTFKKFANGKSRCKLINPTYEPNHELGEVDQPEFIVPRKEFYNALLNPDMLPAKTQHNIDERCNYSNMFKSDQDQKEFGLYFVQNCYKKNYCEIDTENMQVNVT